MQNDKISTYLGFCIRSGKIVFGVDRAEALKKGVHLLIADSTLSENSMKVLVKLKEKFSCPLLVTEGVSLSELLHRPRRKSGGRQRQKSRFGDSYRLGKRRAI